MTAPCHVHPRIADYRGAYRHVPFCARPFADDLVRTLALLGAKSGTTAAARRPDSAGFGARDIPAPGSGRLLASRMPNLAARQSGTTQGPRARAQAPQRG